MGDNTFGRQFRITSFGESHGKVIGIVIDGIPAGLPINLEFVQDEMNKRRPGQSKFTTPRAEADQVKIISGTFNGKTTGAPVCMIIENKDVDSSKYEKFKHLLRPSQVDYVALKKYGGFSDYRGSGRFSGRLTAGFVMAGALAKIILDMYNIKIFAYTKSVGGITDKKHYNLTNFNELMEKREASPLRVINKTKSDKMESLITQVKEDNDSIGGTIRCIIQGVPGGIGGPLFYSLESDISKAMFSIPAIKAIGFGAGFKAAKMRGSEHNDPWRIKNQSIETTKNDAGGIIGGISTGMPIEFEVAIKPTATIGKVQNTVDIEKMEETEIHLEGRHDPCIVPRAVVVVEAMAAIVILDHMLIQGKIPLILKK